MVLDRNQMRLAFLDTRSTIEQGQASLMPSSSLAVPRTSGSELLCREPSGEFRQFARLLFLSSLISGGRCRLDIGWLRHVLPPTRGRSLTYKHGGVKTSRRYGREQKVRHSIQTAMHLGKLYYTFKRGSNHLSTQHACGEGGACANRRT